nr:unknown [Zea mays]
MELDRRARKRYRLLSDVYAATRPVAGAGTGADNARKRKRGHEPTEAEPRRRVRRSGRYDDGDQYL